ncbi:hypothetical protein GALMADRAFT_281900 [Galerina marginata CBS 339.88]|uniref:Uncharacterized protein n=1 Tax=Galerina marginata (strain CBS 339.88) TaxID=685588 RepID=A0A067SX06_GALM3|nr:hypothetical protein GALMADRAFT_281900 [Galerina marginata CBS 339.88]
MVRGAWCVVHAYERRRMRKFGRQSERTARQRRVKRGDAEHVTEKMAQLNLSLANEPLSEVETKNMWVEALKNASEKLDIALGLATNAVDFSSDLIVGLPC